jgi:hypothetical protein
MAAPTLQDVFFRPLRIVATPFELAARRLIDEWLAANRITVSQATLGLALDFLGRAGLAAEALADGERVRIRSERGRVVVVSREAAVVTALRCLATRDVRLALARAA